MKQPSIFARLYAHKVILALILLVVFVVSASLGYFGFSLSKIFVGKDTQANMQSVSEAYNKPIPTPQSESVISVLLLGYGGAGHDGGTLSDVLMLARIDYKKKEVALISIPRDLWVSLPVRSDSQESYKINMAHAIGVDDTRYPLKEPRFKGEAGGGTLAKVAVEKVTGIPVDYFVSVSFDGFSQAVDILDGIEVNVPVSFTDSFYPVKGLENETCGFTIEEINEFHAQYSGFELEKQFTCRYEVLEFTQGTMHMDGATALKFVRSRHSDSHGGDFARSERQQALLTALRDKLVSLGALTNTKDFVDKMAQTIRTDLDLDASGTLLDLIGDPQEYSIKTINLTTENVLVNGISAQGAYILLPKEGDENWTGVRQYIAGELAH